MTAVLDRPVATPVPTADAEKTSTIVRLLGTLVLAAGLVLSLSGVTTKVEEVSIPPVRAWTVCQPRGRACGRVPCRRSTSCPSMLRVSVASPTVPV